MKIYDLEARGKTPIYEYLYTCLREDILSGELAADEKLPSRRAMALSYAISVITVENAYAQLLMEGYIYTKPKKGYFVSRIGRQATKAEVSAESTTSPQVAEKPQKIDLSSSHIAYDHFPFSVWTRLLRRTILDSEKEFLHSPAPTGVWELRRSIAGYLERTHGMQVDPECIVVGAGMEYLYGLLVQLLGRHRMIAVEDPGYTKVSRVYEGSGVRCVHVPIDEYGLSAQALSGNAVSAVHISPSHHFPTGIVMPAVRRHEILSWASENDAYVVEDDYDSEFRFQGHPLPPMASIDPAHVIYMNTFSRTLAPSLRVAYMVLPKQLAKRFEKRLGFYSSTVSGFEQYALAAFISEGYYERHINRMRHFYRDHRSRILQVFAQSPLAKRLVIEEKNAGLHFLVSIREVENDEAFVQALEERGVRLRAVAHYMSHENPRFRHRFVINYASLDEEALRTALQIIEDVLAN